MVAQQVLERSLPPSVLLNVNIHLLPWDEINGFEDFYAAGNAACIGIG